MQNSADDCGLPGIYQTADIRFNMSRLWCSRAECPFAGQSTRFLHGQQPGAHAVLSNNLLALNRSANFSYQVRGVVHMVATRNARSMAIAATWVIAAPTLPLTWLFGHFVVSTDHAETGCRDLGRRISLFLTGLGFWTWSSWYVWNAYRFAHTSPFTTPVALPDDVVVAVLDVACLVAWTTLSLRFIGCCFEADTPEEEVKVAIVVREPVFAVTSIAVLALLVLIFIGF